MVKESVWIFEDQLSHDLPVLSANPNAIVFMVESKKHWTTWPFQKRRIAYLASAMRHFVDELKRAGRKVDYYSLIEKGYFDSISALKKHIQSKGIKVIHIAEPSEYHTRQWIETLREVLNVEFRFDSRTLFLTDRAHFSKWAKPLKSPVMEHFYRKMRKQTGLLMDGDEPVGGQWNLDKENRKSPPDGLIIPTIPSFKPDKITRQAIEDVQREFPSQPGSLDGFDYPVTRADSLIALRDFLDKRLPLFGDYEDAMITGQPSLFHSVLSMSLNAGLLSPMEMARAAEQHYNKGLAPLNSVEGFIRQIIGWREYVYGIYWTFMPEYRNRNTRESKHALPQWFWTGKTDMNCLHQCITQVVDTAYNHHIQRLMVICNFATLAGLSPQEVNDWFYAMYIDSHDWVVTPNVIGMGMNADHNTIATKPYISSAAYINRMSNYCSDCRYDYKSRTGPNACPFNYLYWTFLKHFSKTLCKNPRMSMIVKNADKIDPIEMKQMMQDRKAFVQLHVNKVVATQ